MFDVCTDNLNEHQLLVLRAANESDSVLLITGSTGTGKSHLAYALHCASKKRAQGRWFKINLATLSENLIESELFGHERGAFTGADTRRVGRLEMCNGGTVFLDEIGELPLRLQAKLLDFIQYKRITPVGSNREIELDVRIIAATNKNLDVAVRAGEFRADLFHRLNVFQVRLTDLALNPDSILQFAKHFIFERCQKSELPLRSLSKEVEQLFKRYPWPGNLRELENAIEFALAMEKSNCIQLLSLPEKLTRYAREHGLSLSTDFQESEAESSPEQKEIPRHIINGLTPVSMLELPITMNFHESKDFFEKAYLEQALRWCRGQINLTSRRIGLNKVSLTDKIKKYEIDWRKIRYESLGPHLRSA